MKSMPKRRDAGAALAGPPPIDIPEAEEIFESAGAGEPGVGEFEAGQASAAPEEIRPVYREGAADRLLQPLSRAEEVPRFNALWARFQSGDALSPEEMGELHEYAVRRLNMPAEAFRRSRSFEDASELVSRARQVEAIERRLSAGWVAWIALSSPRADAVEEARRMLASAPLSPEREELSSRERQMLRRYERSWKRREEIPAEELRLARSLAIRGEREKHRELMGESAGGAPVADLVRLYAEHQDAAEFVGYLDSRLRESEPGFSAPEPLNAERFHQTIDYLRRRAGPVNDVERPTGRVLRGREARRVRLPEPRAVENPPRVALLVPPNLASQRLREHAEALGIRVVNSPAPPPDADVVVNWGFSEVSVPEGFRVVNGGGSAPVSDKCECLRRLGDLAPRTARDWNQAALLGERVVGKQSKGATRGAGKEVLDVGSEAAARRNYRYDLFQEFFPERDEYRVVLLGDSVLTAHSKNAVPGSLPEDLSPRREYVRLSELPRGVLEMAKEARRRVGVDLAGVDIVRDRRTGRWYVLEVNAAPGMSEATLRRLVEEARNFFQPAS